jgi:hypothetical protein
MKVTYQLTANDLRDVLSSRKKRRVTLIMAFVFIVLSLMLPWFTVNEEDRFSAFLNTLPLTIVMVLWFALSLWWPYRLAAKQLKESPSLRHPITADVSDNGINFLTAHGHSEDAWTGFAKWRESDISFMLYTSSYFANVIPKRAFAAGEEQQFRNLLASKVKKE